ncbi:hypothetical protein DNTS_009643 [Danionella cerebrum]|uniref:Uncharacterized protein n=1 Tax=Danionella cerebrum TaxID=2873325 RepID=A0A553R4P5_9TELE|nr:hypothetical protein DNTS_009643 [Danionella translucida]
MDVIFCWKTEEMMSGKHYKGQEVSCCIKYFIFGFNILFWLLGVAFLGIGLWAWSEKGVLSNISSITDLGGFDPVWLFIVVGGVMFILGFAGCIGALRENTFLLKFFSVFLGIIFFLELTTGVLAFVFKDWIKDQLNFFINNNIRAYRDDIDLQNLIDFTQEYWECCGAFGADDWNLNIYFNCTSTNPSREKCGVPFSCCTKDPAEDVINTQCGYDVREKSGASTVPDVPHLSPPATSPQPETLCVLLRFVNMKWQLINQTLSDGRS